MTPMKHRLLTANDTKDLFFQSMPSRELFATKLFARLLAFSVS